MTTPPRSYRDLHEHLDALEKRGLLRRVDRPINKDTEMHPLVRWQFVGGMDEAERKAFLFTNITDGEGRKYDIPVVVGAIARLHQTERGGFHLRRCGKHLLAFGCHTHAIHVSG